MPSRLDALIRFIILKYFNVYSLRWLRFWVYPQSLVLAVLINFRALQFGHVARSDMVIFWSSEQSS